jgi:hypothetical protein
VRLILVTSYGVCTAHRIPRSCHLAFSKILELKQKFLTINLAGFRCVFDIEFRCVSPGFVSIRVTFLCAYLDSI